MHPLVSGSFGTPVSLEDSPFFSPGVSSLLWSNPRFPKRVKILVFFPPGKIWVACFPLNETILSAPPDPDPLIFRLALKRTGEFSSYSRHPHEEPSPPPLAPLCRPPPRLSLIESHLPQARGKGRPVHFQEFPKIISVFWSLAE